MSFGIGEGGYPLDYIREAEERHRAEEQTTKGVKELFPGYTVEKLPEPPDGEIGFSYQVNGPRGKNWRLMRNKVNPHMLFPMPENVLKGALSIRGVKWFTDKSGELKPCG